MVNKTIDWKGLEGKSTWTLKEFCSYTGFSASWAYKLTMDNKVPFSKPCGKKIFFHREEVLEWLHSNHINPTSSGKIAMNYLTENP